MDRIELLDLLSARLGLCGCGDVFSATALLLDLLEAGNMRDLGLYDESRETIDDCLGTSDDFARDLPLFWLHASGLVAHGSTLDDYGLSADGDRVLDALRLFGPEGVWTGDMDDDNEPETVRDLVPDRTLN